MKRCIAFFNFGNKCVLELLVATYSLRKHYSGAVVWCLAKDDKWNEQLVPQVGKLNVEIIWSDFAKMKRNTKSAVKPSLFKQLFELSYESVIMCDGDLLFMQPIDELWEPLEANGCVLTNFCNWKTDGKIMRARLNNLRGILTDEQVEKMCDSYPSVNIGVMGFTKDKGRKALRKWTEMTEKLAGKHIADEIAAHVIKPWYDCYIAGPEFNASAKIGDLSKIELNKVVHYHGGSQGGGEAEERYENRRRSSRLWMAALHDFYKSGVVPSAKSWEQYATGGVYEILQANPNLPEECSKEFTL
jgi:hypothetical protein